MTTENLIRLLEAKESNAHDLHDYWKSKRKRKWSTDAIARAIAYSDVISLLTDPDYAKSIWEIFFPEEVMT